MMSPKRKPTAQRTKARRADGDVGYGRPPRECQFQPGQCGNPKGRPKGSKNEATILDGLLRRKVSVREGDKVKQITVLEAILLRFTEDSLKGNVKSAAFLLNRYRVLTGDRPEPAEPTDDDQQILDAFARQVLAQNTTKRRRS
jgi:hypothetical protein